MTLQFKPRAVFDQLRPEIGLVVAAVAEKGPRRFARALGLSAFLVAAAYFIVYLPPLKKTMLLRKQIENARILADYGERFKALRDQLNATYSLLPNDREQWLSNAIRDSLTAGGLETESFGAVREQEQAGLVFQTSSVSLMLNFAQFYAWLGRLENSKTFVRLQTLDLSKDKEHPGQNKAVCEIATVIAKRRFR